MNYQIIKKEDLKKSKQYNWFRKFSNPCYGFNVKMDVTKVVNFTKNNKQSFFINMLYIVTKSLNEIEEMRLREVYNEIRLYDVINPGFTVMTKTGVFENAGFEMENDYKAFYNCAKKVIDNVKNQSFVKETFNDSSNYNEYYITCLPWVSIEAMTHPLIDNDYASLSCPRICWDKYRVENDKIVLTLNITVNHCFVDGYPLANAFNLIQNKLDNVAEYLK